MTARRQAARLVATGFAPLALAGLAAGPAAAHGSMTDPVSRVSACFAEGPESPKSGACKAAVAAGGTQPLYDWNEVNIADAAGKHRSIIPDGKLCSAGRDKYKGLDLPRADWPSSRMSAGKHTFRYKATAPHKGSFALYLTRSGYNPKKPLKWSDLEAKPFAKVSDPKLVNGEYVFSGKVPKRTGRHLIYSVWQRSDSPEAFYTCSDVVFGKGSGVRSAAAASGPSDQQIEAGAARSTVDHNGHGAAEHGGDTGHGTGTEHGHGTRPENGAETSSSARGSSARSADAAGTTATGEDTPAGNAPVAKGAITQPVDEEHLAQTGGDSSTAPLAMGGAAVLALGASVLFATRRKAAHRRG
ncbi:lytic polysaccharide monooxygenase [Streptomyces sp. bgisy100]|uniref:lytic polysaccharide monooxygenase n=1 Tax=Streptomyces sp. bgisy100 TaxID=3413783 RepID=UPI003D72DDFA